MRSASPRLIAALVAVAAISGPAAAAQAAPNVKPKQKPKPATVTGTVLTRETARHALVVAGAKGVVSTLRTSRAVRPGARVRATVLRLADGTFRVSGIRTKGMARHARVHATVVSATLSRLVVSAGGSVFALSHGRTTAALGGSPDLHAGDVVNAVVGINSQSRSLTESNVKLVGTTGFISLAGTIQSLASGSFVVAVDRGALTTITIPSSLALPSTVAVGDQVEVQTQYANGTFTLVTIQDDHAAAASTSTEGEHSNVEAEGVVSDLSSSSLTVQPDHGAPVTFAVPSGFNLGSIAVGDHVHAKGQLQSDGSVALATLQLQTPEGSGSGNSSGSEQSGSGSGSGSDQSGSGSGGEQSGGVETEGTLSAVGSGSLTVQPKSGSAVTYTVPATIDVSTFQVGDHVNAKGTTQADGSIMLTRVRLAGDGSSSGSTGSGDSGSNGSVSGDTGSSGSSGSSSSDTGSSGSTGSGNTGSGSTGSGNTGSGNIGSSDSGSTGSGSSGSGSTGSSDSGSTGSGSSSSGGGSSSGGSGSGGDD